MPVHLNVIMMITIITTTEGTITTTEDIPTTDATTDVKINTETTMMTDAKTTAKDMKIGTTDMMTRR